MVSGLSFLSWSFLLGRICGSYWLIIRDWSGSLILLDMNSFCRLSLCIIRVYQLILILILIRARCGIIRICCICWLLCLICLFVFLLEFFLPLFFSFLSITLFLLFPLFFFSFLLSLCLSDFMILFGIFSYAILKDTFNPPNYITYLFNLNLIFRFWLHKHLNLWFDSLIQLDCLISIHFLHDFLVWYNLPYCGEIVVLSFIQGYKLFI